MAKYMTPGVLIEQNAFPNSIVSVNSAVPAFVGYTQQAVSEGKDISNKAVRINSLPEFETIFGKGPFTTCTIKPADNGTHGDLQVEGQNYSLHLTPGTVYNLYQSIRLFYQNGGGYCYIVSVGNYNSPISTADLLNGLKTLETIDEVTLLAMPDAVLLPDINNFATVANAMLNQCGKLNNRFAILDVYNGYTLHRAEDEDTVAAFRQAINSSYLNYGAAYFPFVNSDVAQLQDIGYKQFINRDLLQQLINPQLPQPLSAIETQYNETSLNQYLQNASPNYLRLAKTLLEKINLLPQSGAIAGIYTAVDYKRGVWKAPANVSLSGIASPSVTINAQMQEELTFSPNGKAINVIREYTGIGNLLWGGRTLDSNNQDWKYINVRRTVMMIETSTRLAIKAYAFEPNTANTWITVKSMIRNYLTNLWKQGALAGSKPDEAFSVEVGLGATMTATDILNGIMRVVLNVAAVHPAEFIVIELEQKMQSS